MSTALMTVVALLVLVLVPRVLCFDVLFDPPAVDRLVVDEELNVTVLFDKKLLSDVFDGNVSTVSEPDSILGSRILGSTAGCFQEPSATCNVTLVVRGRFLGFGSVHLVRRNSSRWPVADRVSDDLKVTVVREDRVINKVFTAFVAVVVTVNYINMGCALDLEVVKRVLRRPVGPVVGFACQCVVMPLVSYAVGQLLFDEPVKQFGLFTFGSSPGGGASNMWTVLLGGNLNLSITMTFVSTVAALGTLPLWLFTLGKTILSGTDIVIPYRNVLTSLGSFVVAIGIGLLIQKYLPRVAATSRKILAPLCIAIIVVIVVLATVANLYIFQLLSWRMVVAASLSVWTGFCAGALASLAFRLPRGDVIAVAIETGIQNTGIAFVLLTYSLKPPVSEMASVVPVAGSIITPIPLFIMYCVQKARNCCCGRRNGLELQPINVAQKEMKELEGGRDNAAVEKDLN